MFGLICITNKTRVGRVNGLVAGADSSDIVDHKFEADPRPNLDANPALFHLDAGLGG